MDYSNCWRVSSINASTEATDNIKEILRQQAQYLKSDTNGKVMAKFSKIANVSASITDELPVMLNVKTENEETKDLPDANTFYKPQYYGFEIYNSSYKFRIFELNLPPLYPVSMFLDEGVLEDAKAELRECSIEKGAKKNEYVIKSDGEFIKSLKAILSGKKVTYIIYRLQQA